tara:strand:+ start:490 stop:3165 length:2676 start_codon:yes stop_codon:yes gene_type:complete
MAEQPKSGIATLADRAKNMFRRVVEYPDPSVVMADQAAPIPEVLKNPRTYIEAEKGAVAGTLGLPGDIGSMSEGVADYIQYMPTFLRAPVQTLMQLPTTEDVKEFGIEKGLLTREETEGVPFQVGEFFSPVSGAAAVKGAKVLSKFGPQAGKYISQEGLLAAERLMDKAPEVFQPRLNIVPEGPTTTTTRTVDLEGFYSVVQEAIPLIKRGKGTGQEFVDEMRTMAKKQGFPEKSFNNEIKAMGLNLDSKFTKEDFVQHLNDKRFTVDVVENKASAFQLNPSGDRFFNETEKIDFDDLPVGDKDYFEEDIKTERRDLVRRELERDLSGGYSLSPKLDREAAFNKAAILKAFDENKTEFIDVDGNTQNFEDKIDSIVYEIAKEHYSDPEQVYQRVRVRIDDDEPFTLFRNGEYMPWQLRRGDGLDADKVVKDSDGEAVVSEDNLAEAQIQTRQYLEEQGLVSLEGAGLEQMDKYALTDKISTDYPTYDGFTNQPNRREILITSPEVGDFQDHFTRTDDTVVSSVMASDWDGPIATTKGDLPASNKVLYADEIQSDLAMANSRWGQRTKIIETDVLPLLDDLRYLSDELRKFQSNRLPPVTQVLQLLLSTTERANYRQFLRSEVKEIIDRAVTNIIDGVSLFDESINPEAVSGNILILADRLRTVIETDPFLYGSFSKNPRLNSILYGDNRLSDKLTFARKKLKQIKGPKTNIPNPWQDTWHELALKKLMKTAVDEGYDYVMVPKSETLVAKWGEGPVSEKAPEGAYRKMYQTVYDRKIPSFLKKYAKQYNSELIDAEIGKSVVPLGTTLIKITPEMKEAAKEGQSLFNIAVGTAAGAGALSTLDKEESEDTFAQGGVVRKQGIGTLNEIARTMFQRPRGVSGLSSVARNMFQ